MQFAYAIEDLAWLAAGGALALIAVTYALVRLERRYRTRLNSLIDARLVQRLLEGYAVGRRRPLQILPIMGLFFLLIALAQPHWGEKWSKIEKQSHDVLICLDTSESMNARNPLPDRLTRAKQKIVAMLDQAPGTRFGLIAFSGDATLQCPLTIDHGYFKSVLDAIDTNSMSIEGTNMSAALEKSIATFQKLDEEKPGGNRNSRAVLFISDGEQRQGDRAKTASDRAVVASEKLSEFARLYVIGVGDPNGAEVTYPAHMSQYLRRTAGQSADLTTPHLSKLDEATLTRMALAGNGAYIRSTPDMEDVTSILGHIEKLNTQSVESEIRMQHINRYQWPLAVAVLLFMAEGVWLSLLPLLRKRAIARQALRTAEARNHA